MGIIETFSARHRPVDVLIVEKSEGEAGMCAIVCLVSRSLRRA